MDVEPYSAESSIASFFAAHAPVTREQCDEYAVHLAGGTATAVPIQGSFSYTVMAGDGKTKIIQFRDPSSDLDRKVLDLAGRVHQGIVPSYTFHGLFCDRLPVYAMEKLSGTPYVYVKHIDPLSDTSSEHSTTVGDFAKFFATSWNQGQDIDPSAAEAMHRDYQSRFELLSEKTGHITGIIDWPEATISPFGMSLWGLENLLGFMDHNGWHYYTNSDTLRSLFWEEFERTSTKSLSSDDKRAIQIARMAGLFLLHGFSWSTGGREVVKESSMSFKYLQAFCATNDSSL
ncbi:uncharacterized protein TRUGW13939_03649 [Talaromyces rugulosus]|uniref:Aminoglycoside phosphotransferase domain-containing protein n=1 Tax=Talaromyces rugulosus TaxID=121627 RepID=A0A7H8QRD3_TALRU|nr:uncharacterized protein TRUGW13939_03649 [Talaromyces rugulosus]QKX56544.1 hypothetical protein TRUGW13939_03649 [Talaromyces rugulosus]